MRSPSGSVTATLPASGYLPASVPPPDRRLLWSMHAPRELSGFAHMTEGLVIAYSAGRFHALRVAAPAGTQALRRYRATWWPCSSGLPQTAFLAAAPASLPGSPPA